MKISNILHLNKYAEIVKNKMIKILILSGSLLSSYTNGKIPKILKILPHLKYFEELIWYTRPDKWSLVALFKITSIYEKKIDEIKFYRYLNMIFIPRIIEMIIQKKKITPQIFNFIIKIANNHDETLVFIFALMLNANSFNSDKIKFLTKLLSKSNLKNKRIIILIHVLIQIQPDKKKLMLLKLLIRKIKIHSSKTIDLVLDYFIKHKDSSCRKFIQSIIKIFYNKYIDKLSIEEKKKHQWSFKL